MNEYEKKEQLYIDINNISNSLSHLCEIFCEMNVQLRNIADKTCIIKEGE